MAEDRIRRSILIKLLRNLYRGSCYRTVYGSSIFRNRYSPILKIIVDVRSRGRGRLRQNCRRSRGCTRRHVGSVLCTVSVGAEGYRRRRVCNVHGYTVDCNASPRLLISVIQDTPRTICPQPKFGVYSLFVYYLVHIGVTKVKSNRGGGTSIIVCVTVCGYAAFSYSSVMSVAVCRIIGIIRRYIEIIVCTLGGSAPGIRTEISAVMKGYRQGAYSLITQSRNKLGWEFHPINDADTPCIVTAGSRASRPKMAPKACINLIRRSGAVSVIKAAASRTPGSIRIV